MFSLVFFYGEDNPVLKRSLIRNYVSNSLHNSRIVMFYSLYYQHKFHDEYSKNTPVPLHYIQSNTLTKDDPLPEPEPEEVNEEPIRKKKQNETKATPRPTEEHPHAYENHLMAESPEQRYKVVQPS